jgi:hypothetical protein
MGGLARIAVVVAAAFLALAACGGASSGSPSSTPTSAGTARHAAAGACTNTWMPVAKGATWTLTSQNPAITGVFTITDVTATSFVMEASLMGYVTKQNWNCALDGLANTSGNALSVSLPSLTASTTVLSATGVTLPSYIRVGDTWIETTTSETDISGMGKVSGTSTSKSRAIGVEQVIVPAGKFECMHVKVETSATTDDGSPPTVFQIDAWYGRQKGFVKMAASVGGGGRAELVLTSYSIP